MLHILISLVRISMPQYLDFTFTSCDRFASGVACLLPCRSKHLKLAAQHLDNNTERTKSNLPAFLVPCPSLNQTTHPCIISCVFQASPTHNVHVSVHVSKGGVGRLRSTEIRGLVASGKSMKGKTREESVAMARGEGSQDYQCRRKEVRVSR